MGFSPKQLEIFKFGQSNYDAIILDGSVRSGKSAPMSIAYILWLMSRFKNQNFILASQSVNSAERNVIKPLMQVRYLREQFDINYIISTRCLTLKRGKVVNYIYVFGGKDESSYATVQGITAAGALLDEVVLMPESFVNQVLARCSVEGSKYWFNCNPEGPSHWFKKNWIDKAKERNALHIKFDMNDNPSLSEEVKERYRNMYSGVFYERYILGRWVKAEGIIWKKFAENNEKYLLDEPPRDIMLINMGVDFGGNKSATTFVATGFTKGLQNVVVLESKRITEELSPNMLDDYFVFFCQMVFEKYKRAFVTRADNAEPVLMRGLKNACIFKNLHTQVKPALKRSVSSRIKLIDKLMSLGRFFIVKHNTDVINALNEAVWDEKKTDTRLDNGTTDIDTLDALEYSIEEFMFKLISIEGEENE